MVEIIEVDEYFEQRTVGLVRVKSLEHLKKIAETFEEHFIFKKGKKEYIARAQERRPYRNKIAPKSIECFSFNDNWSFCSQMFPDSL